MDPLSFKSDKIGFLSIRFSTFRLNCDKAIIGILNSRAKVFNERVILIILELDFLFLILNFALIEDNQ
jgi:hypothetical protein